MHKCYLSVLFALPLLLPGLAGARSAGGPDWGGVLRQPSRPRLPRPGHHGPCHLDGTVWASGSARNRNTDHLHLTLKHRWNGGLTRVYGVRNQYRPEEYAVVVYQTNRNLVHILRYYAPQRRITDDSGSLSADCRHMRLSGVTSDGAFGGGRLYRER